MEKSEMMKKYEDETDIDAIIPAWAAIHDVERDEICNPEYTSYLERQLEEAQAKAESYDRLMSGGKKTLKELANFLGMNVAVEDEEIYGKKVFASPIKMFLKTNTTIYGSYKFWALSETGPLFQIPPDLIDFTGDWKDSLTLPDGWEEK